MNPFANFTEDRTGMRCFDPDCYGTLQSSFGFPQVWCNVCQQVSVRFCQPQQKTLEQAFHRYGERPSCKTS